MALVSVSEGIKATLQIAVSLKLEAKLTDRAQRTRLQWVSLSWDSFITDDNKVLRNTVASS